MSNKKRKRLISPTLSNVPLVEPKAVGDPTGNESLVEFRRRYNREQKERREAETARMIGDLNDTMIQLRAAQRDALFKIPSGYLTEHCTHAPARVDGTPENLIAEIRAARNEFRLNLERSGVILHPSAMDKFRTISELNPTVDLRSVTNWQTMYSHMDECGVFTDTDRTMKQKRSETPVEKPTLDAILDQNNGETTEGRKRMVKAVEHTLVNRDWANCWAGFANSLYESFSGFMLTERQKQTFIETMWRRNLSLNRPADYDVCRVALVRSGDLPSHLLYPSELLANQIEDADLNDREVRRQIAQRSRQLAAQN